MVLALNSLFTIATAAVLFVWGGTLRRRVSLLLRFCIPPAVIGGISGSLIVLALRVFAGVGVEFDLSFQYPMMLAFFATVGLGGSFRLIRTGGLLMVIYLLSCWAMSLFQNVIGVLIADLMGANPLIGVMAGAVSLSGGHANAAAFGPIGEALGASGAEAVALSSATYGLVAGALLGGPVAARLIKRRRLAKEALCRKKARLLQDDEHFSGKVDGFSLFKMVALISVFMALGDRGAGILNEYANVTLGWRSFHIPGYVCSMFMAVAFRNFNDIFKPVRLDEDAVNLIASVCLGFFLTMGMMNLRLWELSGLGITLVVILAVNTLLIVAVSVLILFPMLGGDFDAAVICSGFIGHGMGATPNAISNMNSVCDRFGTTSERAFLIVPLCSAFLVDLFALPQILWFLAFFGN
jgi:ESS family glutamate:Na+ symporter